MRLTFDFGRFTKSLLAVLCASIVAPIPVAAYVGSVGDFVAVPSYWLFVAVAFLAGIVVALPAQAFMQGHGWNSCWMCLAAAVCIPTLLFLTMEISWLIGRPASVSSALLTFGRDILWLVITAALYGYIAWPILSKDRDSPVLTEDRPV